MQQCIHPIIQSKSFLVFNNPFGPWTYSEIPILVRKGKPYEKDEIIAPQLIFNPVNGKKHVYYRSYSQKRLVDYDGNRALENNNCSFIHFFFIRFTQCDSALA
jgi:hypothetical protein